MKGVTKFSRVDTAAENFVDKSSRISTYYIRSVRSATVSSVVSSYKRDFVFVATLVTDISYFWQDFCIHVFSIIVRKCYLTIFYW